MTPAFESLVDLLGYRAALQPDDTAYPFLESGGQDGPRTTWAELDTRCQAIGAAVRERVAPGSRVLLLYPPGLEFVAGFFGCLYGGGIAVPTYPPAGNKAE